VKPSTLQLPLLSDEYPFNAVHIHHFRSVGDCTLKDLRQINVLIGRPNTGKTNIIDALTLLGIPELTDRTDMELKHLLRAETPEELFFLKGTTQYANVTSNRSECLLQYSEADGLKAQLAFDTIRGELIYNFNTSFQPTSSTGASVDTVIKRYRYLDHIAYGQIGGKELGTPYGHNLFTLLEENPGIQGQIAKVFAGTGFKCSSIKTVPKYALHSTVHAQPPNYTLPRLVHHYSDCASTWQPLKRTTKSC
jgi:hypothetical protein